MEAGEARASTAHEQMLLIKGYVQRIRELEDNIVFKNVVRPVLEDLFLLHDHIASQRKSANESLCVVLDAIDADLLNILARQNVRLVPVTLTTLNTKYQKVVKTVPAEPLRDNEVVEIPRDGFADERDVLRPQEVVVRKLKS